MNEQTRLLNTREAARQLDLSPRTLERYRVSGGGPEFLKLGGAVRYTAAKLNEWFERCTRTSTSDDGRASKKKKKRDE